jgi:pilus assembly protein CpaB
MSLRTALLAAVVLGLGGLGIVVWIGMQLPSKPPAVAATEPVRPPMAQILAAAHPLRAGYLLKYDDIQPHDVLTSEVPAGAIADTPQGRAELVGAMVRRGLQPLEILLPADVLRPGDHGFLAAVLRPGMRATTVGVDAVSGTAGLIWPGDHVDVLLTQVTEDLTLPAARRASAESVLGDVRVIAIDQQLMQGATGTGTAAEQGALHTVTLEVTETQAERLTLAARLGHLSLIVRAADALPDAENVRPRTTWGGDVSQALNQGRTAGRVMRVYHGTTEGKEFRF